MYMSEVWSFIIQFIKFAVNGFKSITVWQGNGYTVYLWEFLIALLLITIVSTALVSTITVAPGMAYTTVANERKAKEREKYNDAKYEARRAQRQKEYEARRAERKK